MKERSGPRSAGAGRGVYYMNVWRDVFQQLLACFFLWVGQEQASRETPPIATTKKVALPINPLSFFGKDASVELLFACGHRFEIDTTSHRAGAGYHTQ